MLTDDLFRGTYQSIKFYLEVKMVLTSAYKSPWWTATVLEDLFLEKTHPSSAALGQQQIGRFSISTSSV